MTEERIEYRAENLNTSTLLNYTKLRGPHYVDNGTRVLGSGKGKGTRVHPDVRVNYERERIYEFLNSNNQFLLTLYGPRGMGKTMAVRLALAENNMTENYYGYYQTRKIPDLQTIKGSEVIVLDDIHYLMDDVKSGVANMHDLVKTLFDAVQLSKTGKKVIIVSEDVWTMDYMVDSRYNTTAKELCKNMLNIPADWDSVFKCYNITDTELQRMIISLNATVRGVVELLNNAGKTWESVCDFCYEAALSKDIINKIAKARELPRFNYNKKPHGVSEDTWFETRANVRKKIWANEIEERNNYNAHLPELIKHEIKTRRPAPLADINLKIMVKAVLEQYIYSGHGYFDRLMLAGEQSNTHEEDP